MGTGRRLRLDFILEISRPQLAVGRDDAHRLAVVIELQISAARLPQIKYLEPAALRLQVDRLPRQLRRDADAAQSIQTVLAARQHALRLPPARFAALQIQPPIARKGL